MNDKGKLIDFTAERTKRIHGIHEKRLKELQDSFVCAFPLPENHRGKTGKRSKKRPSKKN